MCQKCTLSFKNSNSKDYLRYGEFHNGISKPDRKQAIKTETEDENIHGKLIKIMMFSPAGAEGISLKNIREIHAMEPYWNSIRLDQVTGRGVRAYSHIDLPR